jgi:ribosome biogenesis GTPase
VRQPPLFSPEPVATSPRADHTAAPTSPGSASRSLLVSSRSVDLGSLGWDDEVARAFAPHAVDGQQAGRVARVDRGGHVLVLSAEGPVRARTTARMARDPDPMAHPTVGDWVVVRSSRDDSLASVEAVLPRRSAFLRHASGKETVAQALAANVDTAFVVVSVASAVNPRRLERLLTIAWSGGAVPVVIGSKADACADLAGARAALASAAVGVEVLLVSAVTQTGVADLAGLVTNGQTVVLLGASGVGKSTLVNCLLGEERLATKAIRHDGKGRHTTTSRELVALPAGGVLIDTPGLRGLALWDTEEGLDQTFADIEALAGDCRFRDCAHTREPSCAVRGAVADGTLAADRLAAYDKLQRELAYLARKQDRAMAAAESRRWKVIHASLRDHPKLRDRR